MSGGSQHNPNGRPSQLNSGWSPLQLQMANLLARAPATAHMQAERGVTWHTPTPPPHLYHVPAPSPPDPLQAMKAAGANPMFRHSGTPPELYRRHTPTPPDKHLMRHTPSPGDIKSSAALPPVDLYQHLGSGRDKMVRPEELLAYARVGVDLSLSGGRAANGAATSPAPPAPAPAPALSVRDAPTINSLIARAQPRHAHARVDALLERLVPSPVSPHSVIVHSRAAPTPSPPSSNEDSADSCGAPPGSKRKRKPERTVRVGAPPAPAPAPQPPQPPAPDAEERVTPPAQGPVAPPAPLENGDATHGKVNGPEEKSTPPAPQSPPQSHARRKTRSGSAETIADIAAMIAAPSAPAPAPAPTPTPEPALGVTVDKLRTVLAGPAESTEAAPSPPRAPSPRPAAAPPAPPAPAPAPEPTPESPPVTSTSQPVPPAPTVPAAGPATPRDDTIPPTPAASSPGRPAAAPRRRSARSSNAEAPNVPVESPSEARPAEPHGARCAEPAAASFVEVENQLEKMFAGLEEEPRSSPAASAPGGESGQTDGEASAPSRKRRRSAPGRPDRRSGPGRPDRADRKKPQKKAEARGRKGKDRAKDAYDSGSNASSSRSRGPYIQIRGPRDSPLSVSVMNSTANEEEESSSRRRPGEEFRGRGGGAGAGVRGLAARGLHASTLGLRYDARTPDATWLCAFCRRAPHAAALGDLFGPYTLDDRSVDETTSRYDGDCISEANPNEVWFHEACGVWAPGLVAAGARVWGLEAAVWAARAAKCLHCGKSGAGLACAQRACRARAHLPCARKPSDSSPAWTLDENEFRALCPHHAPT